MSFLALLLWCGSMERDLLFTKLGFGVRRFAWMEFGKAALGEVARLQQRLRKSWSTGFITTTTSNDMR